jgi:DNA-binding NarL/FixJ family response regulator
MSAAKRKELPATLAVITSNHLVRLGVQQIDGTTHHIRFVGHAKSEAEAGDLISREQPQVAIIDMEPEIHITSLIQKVKRSAPGSKLILLCGFDDKERTKEAFLAGVDGIVLKIQPPAVLLAVVEYLCQANTQPTTGKGGGTDDLLSSASIPAFSEAGPMTVKRLDGLTDRERDVIVLIGQGLSNKDIADRLCISGITVRHHLTSIFDKLGVTTRQKLLIRAHQFGLVELTASA